MDEPEIIVIRATIWRSLLLIVVGLLVGLTCLMLLGCAATPEGKLKQGLYTGKLVPESLYRGIVRAYEGHRTNPTQYPAVSQQDFSRATIAYQTYQTFHEQVRQAALSGEQLAQDEDLAAVRATLLETLTAIAAKYGIEEGS